MATIRQRRDRLDEDFKALQEAAKALEAECMHPVFERALSMNACVQYVSMCKDCYFVKPMDYTMGIDFGTGVDESNYQVFDG